MGTADVTMSATIAPEQMDQTQDSPTDGADTDAPGVHSCSECPGSDESLDTEHQTRKAALVYLLVVLVLLPIVVVAVAFIFGALLAVCEGWKVVDGFRYVVGNLCGLATPLTDATPTSIGGDLVDVVISVWSLSVVATFVGIVMNMTFNGTMAEIFDTGKIKKLSSFKLEKYLEQLAEMSVTQMSLDMFVNIMQISGYKGEHDSLKKIFERVAEQSESDFGK